MRGSLKVVAVVEKLNGNRLSWFEHVKRGKKTHVVRKVVDVNVEG